MSKEALGKVSDFWMQLINDSMPKEYPSSVEKIIELNQGQMVKVIDKMNTFLNLMSIETLEKFMSKEKYWSSQKRDYIRRIELLRNMLEFRKKGHIEMLDLHKFRMIVDVKKLKCIFAKNHFINLTVQENSFNSLLTLQGYFLKNFIYFHLRHDMRFKASIDSFMIEIDNPTTRQTIREENRKDDFLSKKYLSSDTNGLNVENFCEQLLLNFFPRISGIWADHSQMAPSFILQFIRICLEYGLISSAKAKVYLDLLAKACVNLIKLEDGWVERPAESKKFSTKLKLYNVANMFAKCREHISMILINILVLLKDEYFMEKYPAYVEMDAPKQTIKEDLANDFVLFNKQFNDNVLFITMNYLSNTVEIADFKSATDFSQQAVEKIFFFLTTTQNDCFLSSLKQITRKDLQYITKLGDDPIEADLREMADTMGYTLRTLLNCLGMGYFDSKHGLINTSTSTDEDFEKYLKKYADKDTSPTLETIFKKITADIRDKIKVREDYKVALVKESIPLRLVTFARYCSDYLETSSYKSISKECFVLLAELCEDNNFCKAQLFKYESLIHLRKLLKTIDLDAFMLLFKICKEMNASVFLGKEVFNMFLELYENFNSQILKTLNIESPAETLNMENVATIIMMTKYMNMLFSRPFLNENDKIQNMLLAQESMFIGIHQKYLPLLRDESAQQVLIQAEKKEGYLLNSDFLEGNEGILFEKVRELAKYDNPETENSEEKLHRVERDPHYLKYSKLILANHLAFWSLKVYNKFCSFGYSYKQYELMLPFCKDLKFLMDTSLTNPENDWMLPIGLEAEILIFIGSFRVLPQQNIIIENTLSNIQKVVGSSWLKEKSEIQHQIKSQSAHMNSLQAKLKQHPENQEEFEETKKRIEKLREKQAEFTDEEKKLFINFIIRCQIFSDETKRSKEEAEIYLFEGLLPLLFNYLNSIFKLNLAESSKDGKFLSDQVTEIARFFIQYLPHMNKIAGTQVSVDFTKQKLPSLSLPLKDETDLDDAKRENVGPTNSIFTSTVVMEVEKLEAMSLGYCDSILAAIESLYDNSKYTSPGSIKRDISKEEFVENSAGTKLETKPKSFAAHDPEAVKLALKQKKLKYFIRAYQEAKETYLTREEEPNLIGFFDRNNQNLRGVFNSCLDRLLNRKKGERFSKKEPLSYNAPLSKFWTNRSVRGYVNMVAILVSRSKTGRKELYEFIHDNGTEEPQEDEDEDNHDEEEPHTARDYIEKRRHNEVKDSSVTKVYREDILATLIRIHADLFFFLNSSSSRNDIWWVTHQTYEMISMFFKNLCECNFLQFKDYLAQQAPFLRDDTWTKVCGEKTYSMIFAMELKSIMKTTKIAVNRDPVMIRSDFHDRVSEILNPLMEIINEATIGPCVDNQDIFLNTDTSSLCNIALRLVDDLASPFNNLATIALSVIIALMEGSNNPNQKNASERKGVYEKLSSKLPASILSDRILRFTKKLYVRQLKINGDYDNKVDEKQGKGFFSVISFKKKPQSYSQLPVVSEKPSPITHSKNQIMPANSEMPIDRNLNKEVGEIVEEIIDQDMEDSVNISHWKDLLVMYMKNKEFYTSPIFEVSFRMMVLWKNLASISKTHMNRLKEIEYESESYFKKASLFGSSDQKVKLNKTPSELSCVYYFITKKIMCGIEILDPQQQSVLLYFPKLPATFMLAEEAKRNYREGCDIADSNTKMVDLMQNFDLFKIKMESSYQMADKLGFFYNMVSTDAFYYYTIFCWLIGFALNIALLVGVSYVNNSDDYVATTTNNHLSIIILGIMLIAVSGLFLLLWVLTKFVQTYRTSKEDYIFDRALKRTDPIPLKAKIYIAVKKSFVDQPFPMSYTLHVFFTALGLTVSPFFLTLNLLLIINFSKTTEFVLQAITLHIDQLALTLMLAIFVIYFYTLIVMDYFFDSVNVEPGNTICNELSTCFFFVFNYGLRNGGGMAESLKDLDPTKKFPGRTIFDISFFMLVNVISLNIIFGIIIDTFSQLRDAQNERGRIA